MYVYSNLISWHWYGTCVIVTQKRLELIYILCTLVCKFGTLSDFVCHHLGTHSHPQLSTYVHSYPHQKSSPIVVRGFVTFI